MDVAAPDPSFGKLGPRMDVTDLAPKKAQVEVDTKISSSLDDRPLTVFYLFAGVSRKNDVGSWLKQSWQGTLILHEIDLLRNPTHDLSDAEFQESLLTDIEDCDVVITTPPCSTHSRASWSNSFGPRPLRSRAWPLGFPWLAGKVKAKAELANTLVEFSWRIVQLVMRLRRECKHFPFCLLEHPEDLGNVKYGNPGSCPASIWQGRMCKLAVKESWHCIGIRQCDFDAPTPKPTRLLISPDGSSWLKFFPLGVDLLPVFNDLGDYVGPIKRCSHWHEVKLTRSQPCSGPFRTAMAAQYPSSMCRAIALLAISSCLSHTRRGGVHNPRCFRGGRGHNP